MNKFIIPNLIFDTGTYKKRDSRLPLRLPFELDYNDEKNLIVQKSNEKVRRALERYYSSGGYASSPLGEGQYAKKQGDDIFKVIKQSLLERKKTVKNTTFLEIGAGYGYLLYLLKKEGAKDILGLEPGKEGIEGSKKYGVPFMHDFFPSQSLKKDFDFIFSYAVLEHIENPLFILKEIYKKLNDKGMTFIAVPDNEKKLEIADLSIISHQHFNYFTKNSLSDLMEKAGFKNVKVIESKRRSIIFAWGAKKLDFVKKILVKKNLSDRPIFKKFTSNFLKNVKTIQKLIRGHEKDGRKIGLYAPYSNLLGLLKFKNNPRIFQGDKFKHGKFMAGYPRPIEPPDNLLKQPLDVLFIAPIDYDKEIRENLKKIGVKAEIVSLKTIYEKNSGIKYKISSK